MTIADNLDKVQARVAAAARRAQRSPDEITLVAVSKTMPLALISEAAEAGQIDFGENRLEELLEKVDAAAEAGLGTIRWHAIGTIQSRKTKLALGPIALIHAVDRVKIAQRLSRQAGDAGRTLEVLLEVNVSGEESKHGFTPASMKAALPDLLELPALRYCGLMTMAPFVADPEEARPFFRELRCLLEDIRQNYPAAKHPQATWAHLSMGMTADFEVAIEEGATIIRVGTAIFGHREYE